MSFSALKSMEKSMRWQFMLSEVSFCGIVYGGVNGKMYSTSVAKIDEGEEEKYLVRRRFNKKCKRLGVSQSLCKPLN